MAKILFITTVYRTGEKIYPILRPLAALYDVYIAHLFQMSPATPWYGEFDPRQEFYSTCEDLCSGILNGPEFNRARNGEIYSKFISKLFKFFDGVSPNLVIIDNNITIKGGHNSKIYNWFHERKIPVISCPHGNKEAKGYRVLKHIGGQYDYSFIFGNKEKRALVKVDNKNAKYKNRLLCGGIPSNDVLKTCKRNKRHILIIPNYTDPTSIVKQVKGFRPFTKKVFDKLKILGLTDKYGCGILVKEKNKQNESSELLRDSLSCFKEVSFVKDIPDDNQLIADAVCVISALSTMAFKPIQLGVPTVVLRKHGALGNYADFPGLIAEDDSRALMKTLAHQEQHGRFDDFVKNTLSGGLTFTSTNKYVSHIVSIIGK